MIHLPDQCSSYIQLDNTKGQYYNNGAYKFEGEYYNDSKLKGKLYIKGKLEFEGEFLYDKKI